MITRRHFLTTSIASALLPAAGSLLASPVRPGSQLDLMAPAIEPSLRMVNANTGERMSATFFRDGVYDMVQLRRINWFMRDWRQARMKPFDLRLLWALSAIRHEAMRQGHSGEITILSGFRTPETNQMLRERGIGAARNSFHLQARAADFRLEGIPVAWQRDMAGWLEVGGVGYYPGAFVHIDSGDQRSWVG